MSTPFGPTRESCPETGCSYLRLTPDPSGPAGVVAFLDGLGLDGSGYGGFLEGLAEKPAFRHRYPYLTHLHVAPTTPGFGAPVPGQPPLSMAEQAHTLARFLERRLEEAPGELVLYGFSFGSDLAVDLLEACTASPRLGAALRRVVLTEPNTHAGSCFFSSRIAEAWEAWKRTPRGQPPHELFRKAVLLPHAGGVIPRDRLDDITRYCQDLQSKDWAQLAASSREISADPAARIRRLLQHTPAFPQACVEVILCAPTDLEALLDLVADAPVEAGLPRVIHTPQAGHFHHAKPRGILENLRGHAMEVPLPRA